MRRLALVASAAAIAVTLAACGGGEAEPASSPQPAPGTAGQGAKVDPRQGGFEVALGEWAITPEAGEGVYKLECNVEGHDDRGMEMLFEVRRDAPLAAVHP